jgi:nitrogen fixation NifU-like protein
MLAPVWIAHCLCGDVMRLQIKSAMRSVLKDARFKTWRGSAISSSLVTEVAKGKNLDQAGEIKNSHIA